MISCARATAATTFASASRHSWTNASRDGRESERCGVRWDVERNAYVDWNSEALKWAPFDRAACGRARGTTLSRQRDLGGYDRLASSFLVDRPAHLQLARPRRRPLGVRFHARRHASGACALRHQWDGACLDLCKEVDFVRGVVGWLPL